MQSHLTMWQKQEEQTLLAIFLHCRLQQQNMRMHMLQAPTTEQTQWHFHFFPSVFNSLDSTRADCSVPSGWCSAEVCSQVDSNSVLDKKLQVCALDSSLHPRSCTVLHLRVCEAMYLCTLLTLPSESFDVRRLCELCHRAGLSVHDVCQYCGVAFCALCDISGVFFFLQLFVYV